MSDTPRTDAIVINGTVDRFLKLSRQLERENAELRAKIADYESVLEDKRRLTRELDVAMNGEDGAANQASLCDLIPGAQKMRAELTETKARLKESEAALAIALTSLEWMAETPAQLLDTFREHSKRTIAVIPATAKHDAEILKAAEDQEQFRKHSELLGYKRPEEDLNYNLACERTCKAVRAKEEG